MGHLHCHVADFQLRMIRLEGILYFFFPGPSLANSAYSLAALLCPQVTTLNFMHRIVQARGARGIF